MNFFSKVYYKLKLDEKIGILFSAWVARFSGKLHIYDVNTTVDYILHKRCSVARFGDGELYIAAEGGAIGFQKADKGLQRRLKETLKTKSDNLLLCLPSPLNDYSYMTEDAQAYWKDFLRRKRYYCYRIIDKTVQYGDTQFTRPYIDYKNRGGGYCYALSK